MKQDKLSPLDYLKKQTLENFLVTSPPGTGADIRVMASQYGSSQSSAFQIHLDEIELHCTSDTCRGVRFFAPQREDLSTKIKQSEHHFLEYNCKNCEKSSKLYAIEITLIDNLNAQILKIGEIPSFGPPTPTRLLRILESEREYYLKGRRSENQGMGIGAFAYYRRVVENQKNQILEEILKAAENTSAPKNLVESIRAAKLEGQFTKAVESMKGGIPEALLIDGHNPLVLLHKALSDGLHAKTDNDCLELAQSIRIVLSELADRLGEVLKDQSEFKTAISKLMSRKTDDPTAK